MLKTTREKIRFLLLLAAVVLLVLAIESLGFFAGIDTYFYDTFLRLRGSKPVSGKIVIISIDTKTLNSLGKWPLQRGHYAAMLDRLGQAAVVTFDLLLTEPSEDDPILGAAIKKHGRVILAEYVNSNLSATRPLDRLYPFKTGHVHIEPGIDNTVRAVYHSLYCQGRRLYSISSATYEAATGDRLLRQEPPAQQPVSSDSPGLFQQDMQRINYYGQPGSFKQISMADVISGAVQPEFFLGKIVLVGLTTPGVIDQISTPFSQSRNLMPGVEVQANIINNLLDKSFIHEVFRWIRYSVVFCLSLVMGVSFLRMSEKKAAFVACLSLLLTMITAAILLFNFNIWLPISLFLASFSLIFIIAYLYRIDSAARRLDEEHQLMSSLLGWEIDETPEQKMLTRGLFGFLYEGGLNQKIQRLTHMTDKLLDLNKSLETSLKSEQEALEDQVRMIQMLSHEYRTPLAIIQSNLDFLEMKDEVAGGMLAANYSKMKRAVFRLVEVMENSLHRERMNDQLAQRELKEIPLKSFIQALLNEACGLWGEFRFEFDIAECGDNYIIADSSQLKTALLNLIDNAVKYSPESEPIRISTGMLAGEVVFTVHNRGAVISKDTLPHLFDKFYRGATSANTSGAGLGLYLIRKIVKMAHGSISIDSNEADGTLATIKLPLGRGSK